MYSLQKYLTDAEIFLAIISDVVLIEKLFWKDAFGEALLGLNSESMGRYIELVADTLLNMLGCPKVCSFLPCIPTPTI